jgi:hypothetical protein
MYTTYCQLCIPITVSFRRAAHESAYINGQQQNIMNSLKVTNDIQQFANLRNDNRRW